MLTWIDKFELLNNAYEFLTQVRTLYEKQVGFKSIRQYYSVHPEDYVVRSLIPFTALQTKKKNYGKYSLGNMCS